VASVASDLSAVHHAHPGHGARGNAQAASQQDSADSFGSLLDGTDSSPPPPPPSPPSTSAPPLPPQASPDQSADPPRPPPAVDAAQTPSTNPPAGASTGGLDRSDDGKGISAVKPDLKADLKADLGPLAHILDKAGKPFMAANLDATAKSDGLKAVGQTASADPNGGVNAASNAADQGTGGIAGAHLTNRRDDKTATSGSSQAAAVPSTDSTLNALVAPVPQPVTPAATNAPSLAAAAGDDDGAEITQLAAAGNAARPPREGAQATGPAAGDATLGGQSDGASSDAADAETPARGQPASPPALNSPVERANAGGQQAPPNAFADPGAEIDAIRNIHPHGMARPSAEALAGPDRDRPASVVTATDLSQQAGATTGQNLGAPAAANGDSGPIDPGSSANPPPSTATSAITPDSLAAASAATPAVSARPAAAPAPATAPAAVPIAGLAVEIAGSAQAGKKRFEIRLDPPDLGRIDVRLDVDHDGKVTSHLVVDRQETLDMLRRDAPQIERSLQDAGLKTADNGLQFTLRDQSFGQNPYPRNAPMPGAVRIVAADPDLPAVDTVKGPYAGMAGRGGIDIRV
jgi:flagellar hook-length control protein FliK